jgi:hypothetical protein
MSAPTQSTIASNSEQRGLFVVRNSEFPEVGGFNEAYEDEDELAAAQQLYNNRVEKVRRRKEEEARAEEERVRREAEDAEKEKARLEAEKEVERQKREKAEKVGSRSLPSRTVELTEHLKAWKIRQAELADQQRQNDLAGVRTLPLTNIGMGKGKGVAAGEKKPVSRRGAKQPKSKVSRL